MNPDQGPGQEPDRGPDQAKGGGAPIAVQIAAFLLVSLMLAQLVNLTIVLLAPPPMSAVYQLSEVTAALQDRSLQTRMGRRLVRTIGAEPMQPALFRLTDAAADWRRRTSHGWAQRSPNTHGDNFGGGAGRRAEMARHELAGQLNLPETQVRLWLSDAALWAVSVHPFHGPGPGPGGDMALGGGGGPSSPPPNGDAGGPPPSGEPPPPPPSSGAPPSSPNATPYAMGDDPRAHPPFWMMGRPRFDPGQRPIVGDFVAAAQLPDGAWVTVRPQPERFPNGWQGRIILWFVGWLVVFSLAGFLFARRLTAPIGAFARAAEHLGRDPRGPPLALEGPAELGAAARAFNEMQVRIKRYVDDRTAMVGAISHDLRTPLTRIRFKIEGAAPELRAAVLSDVEQMETMISAVLTFIKDASAPPRRERLDLLSLLECEVDSAALLGARVEMLEGPAVTVEADPVGLQRLFGNLIDNAVKYAGGARISLAVVGDDAVVRVCDDGPGLAPGELTRVFDPFYRAEPSRNLDHGGVGLGLSVARSIARAHGGDLTLEPRDPGLAAVVRLPLPPKG